MQAVLFRQYGAPETVLCVEDVPDPKPGPGELLVRMQASPINPSDLLFIEGRYGQPATFPAIPGFEGVGVVESSGGGLMGKLLVGRQVVAVSRRGGNWAETTVIPARQAIPIASDLPLEQAATFFVNPATAVVMTQHVLNIPSGAWLVQSAAASTLGRMIIRLARHSGFRTLNIVRRESQIDELKSIGADEVVKFSADSDEPDALIEQVRKITGGEVRYAIDPVGGLVGSTLVRCLSHRGRMLCYGTLTDEPLSIPPRCLIGTQACVEGFWLGRWMDQQSLVGKIRLMRKITKLIRKGVLTSDIAARIPLSEVPKSIANAPEGKRLIVTGQK